MPKAKYKAAMANRCGNCKWADLPMLRAKPPRPTPRKPGDCTYPAPVLPPLPVCISRANVPTFNRYVIWADEGADCPVWAPIPPPGTKSTNPVPPLGTESEYAELLRATSKRLQESLEGIESMIRDAELGTVRQVRDTGRKLLRDLGVER